VLDRLRSPTPTEQQEHERGVKPTALTSAVEPVTTAPKEISAQSDDTEAGAGGTALPETSKLSETDLDFERYGGGAIERLEVPSPKTRRAARAAKQFNKESVSLIIAGALLIVAAVIAVWYFGFFQNFGKTRNVVTTQPTATESKPEPKTSPPIETPAPPTAAPMPESSVT